MTAWSQTPDPSDWYTDDQLPSWWDDEASDWANEASDFDAGTESTASWDVYEAAPPAPHNYNPLSTGIVTVDYETKAGDFIEITGSLAEVGALIASLESSSVPVLPSSSKVLSWTQDDVADAKLIAATEKLDQIAAKVAALAALIRDVTFAQSLVFATVGAIFLLTGLVLLVSHLNERSQQSQEDDLLYPADQFAKDLEAQTAPSGRRTTCLPPHLARFFARDRKSGAGALGEPLLLRVEDEREAVEIKLGAKKSIEVQTE